MALDMGQDKALGELNDLGLLEKAREGNRRAFEVLFKRHYASVRRIVISVIGPCDDVEDVVQNVFLRVYRTAMNFQGKSKFTSWLFRVAINMTYDHMRQKKRSGQLIEHWLEKHPEPSPGNTPLDNSLNREEVKKVSDALGKLKSHKRNVFILFEIQGLTLDEIAQTLDLSTTTVWSRLYQARKDFKKFYEKAKSD